MYLWEFRSLGPQLAKPCAKSPERLGDRGQEIRGSDVFVSTHAHKSVPPSELLQREDSRHYGLRDMATNTSAKKRLRTHYSYLKEELVAPPYVELLFQAEVLTSQEKQTLTDPQKSQSELARLFVDTLMRKPEWGIDTFFQLLRSRRDMQPHIYDELFPEHSKQQARPQVPGSLSISAATSAAVAPPVVIADHVWASIKADRIVEILRPSLMLDRLRANSLINYAEHNGLIGLSTEFERSRKLLDEVLPVKGPGSLDEFCRAVGNVEGQQHVANEVILAYPELSRGGADDSSRAADSSHEWHRRVQAARRRSRMRRKTMRSKLSVPEVGRQRRMGIKSKRKRILCSRKLTAIEEISTCGSSSSKRAILVFKKEHKQSVLTVKDEICSCCQVLYRIRKGLVKFNFISQHEIPNATIKEIDTGKNHCAYFDTNSVLVNLFVSGVEQTEIEQKRPYLIALIEKLIEGSFEHTRTETMKSALVILRMSMGICFKLLFACCTLHVELRQALYDALPGLRKAELRLGSLPSIDLLNISADEECSSESRAKGILLLF